MDRGPGRAVPAPVPHKPLTRPDLAHATHHNQRQPHRSLYGAASLKPLPQPVNLGQYRVRRHTSVGGTINEYRLVA
jgi:hypothetical protein